MIIIDDYQIRDYLKNYKNILYIPNFKHGIESIYNKLVIECLNEEDFPDLILSSETDWTFVKPLLECKKEGRIKLSKPRKIGYLDNVDQRYIIEECKIDQYGSLYSCSISISKNKPKIKTIIARLSDDDFLTNFILFYNIKINIFAWRFINELEPNQSELLNNFQMIKPKYLIEETNRAKSPNSYIKKHCYDYELIKNIPDLSSDCYFNVYLKR